MSKVVILSKLTEAQTGPLEPGAAGLAAGATRSYSRYPAITPPELLVTVNTRNGSPSVSCGSAASIWSGSKEPVGNQLKVRLVAVSPLRRIAKAWVMASSIRPSGCCKRARIDSPGRKTESVFRERLGAGVGVRAGKPGSATGGLMPEPGGEY